MVTHHAWERRVNAVWRDEYAAGVEVLSTAVLASDDPDERTVLLGLADGRVVMIHPDALDDDGAGIAAMVELGPVRPRANDRRQRLTAVRVSLAQQQGGANLEVRVGDDNDDSGTVAATLALPEGRSDSFRVRARGNVIRLRLVSGTANSRWAFEELTAELSDAGRAD